MGALVRGRTMTCEHEWDNLGDGESMICLRCDSVTTVAPCVRCGRVPEPHCGWAWTISCDNCYCGAPDSATRNDVGFGDTLEQAVTEWNERMKEEDTGAGGRPTSPHMSYLAKSAGYAKFA